MTHHEPNLIGSTVQHIDLGGSVSKTIVRWRDVVIWWYDGKLATYHLRNTATGRVEESTVGGPEWWRARRIARLARRLQDDVGMPFDAKVRWYLENPTGGDRRGT